MMRFVLVLAFLLSGLFGSELGWSNNYAKALEQAKKENKKVYMLITSENCRWCRKFENTTLSEPETLAKLNQKYVLVHVDRDKDEFPTKFLRKHVPRHYILSANGNVIYTFLGYWNSEDFFSFMKEAQRRFSYVK